MKEWGLIIFLLFDFGANAQVISTIAGNGIAANTEDGNPATAASIDYPTGGVFDKFGNYYFTLGTHGNGVRKISTSGIITRVAGTGVAGFYGDTGPATSALLNNAQTVAVDTIGNLYIGDAFNSRIRKIDIATGIITTIAGTGASSYGGDGGPASAADIQPNNLCFDKQGNLYFGDGPNNRIRKINTLGIITTVAGNGIAGYGGNGVPATSVPINPYGICFDNSNNLYFADDFGRVNKITPDGIMHYYIGNGAGGFGGDGGPATAAAMIPTYIKFDKFGNLFIGEMEENRIRLVNNSGIINTIVGTGIAGYNGDGISAVTAQINYPGGITLDSCGNLFIAESHGLRIRKVTFLHCNYLAVKNESRPSLNISIYPNPTNDLLHIDNLKTNATYRLLNIIGATMQQGNLKEGNNTISIQSLPEGMYMLEIADDEGKRTVSKVVKQ